MIHNVFQYMKMVACACVWCVRVYMHVRVCMPVAALLKCTLEIQLTLMMYLLKMELDGEASNLRLRLANIASTLPPTTFTLYTHMFTSVHGNISEDLFAMQ